jgi:hypothetical protein
MIPYVPHDRVRSSCFCLIISVDLFLLILPSPLLRAAELPAAAVREIHFEQDIRPLLEQHCWSCHGRDQQESGLRLDRRDLLLLGGDQGRVVVEKNSRDSRLIHYVAALDPEHVMPPEGDRLTTEQVGILRAWIDQGLTWPASADTQPELNSHWAYQPLRISPIPAVKATQWPISEIDRFILAELERRELTPSPAASRETLIRRLSLDLTGLLPSIEDVDTFVNDDSPEAWEKVVDRLLASPHFGERWGRHWLDMARYADSDGYEKDNARPDAYRWRDWVIDAINADMPFDQFTIEQLAGDLLPDATPLQRLATAFHRQTLTNTEGGTDQEQFRIEACFDRTETTGTVWLGLTVGCARCHTHKYDAIMQREYYQLFSFFNNGEEQTTVVPKSDADVAAFAQARAEYDQRIGQLESQLKAATELALQDFASWRNTARDNISSAASNRIKLHPIRNAAVKSDPPVTFKSQKGGTFLVTGDNPDQANYEITGTINVDQITGLRLDVYPDPSHPAKGPGRASHGNFVLSELAVEVASSPDFADAQALKFVDARADYQQNEIWTPKNVIDGQNDTGWAISPEFGKQHWLVLRLAEPLQITGEKSVRIRLLQHYGKQHTIARFKVAVQTGSDSIEKYPDAVAKALTVETPSEEDRQIVQNHFLQQHPASKDLLAQLDQLQKSEPVKPELTVRVLTQRTADPRHTFVLRRGEFLSPITELEVQSAALGTLPPLTSRHADQPADRLDLAKWLVSPGNPLTPRVAANHIWRILFGQGLVRTPNDFGVRGEKPSHPELLDWLAADFMSGSGRGQPWSRKAMIRRIVTSAVYQQSSRHRPELGDIDPLNILLARQNRLRVEGEIVRDISLQVAGLLSRKIGGPSVYPPLPPGIAELSYAGNFKWKESPGEDRFRRGMYTFFKRTSPHPNLMIFDCPDANLTTVSRQTSNTPLQALTSLNNESFAEAARALAKRMMVDVNQTDEERMALAFRWCLARNGSASELAELQALLRDATAWYTAHPKDTDTLLSRDQGAGTGISPAQHAAWIATARILLNLDEFITRE